MLSWPVRDVTAWKEFLKGVLLWIERNSMKRKTSLNAVSNFNIRIELLQKYGLRGCMHREAEYNILVAYTCNRNKINLKAFCGGIL